jgi:DNA-binding NarL/FixJ family response regulator
VVQVDGCLTWRKHTQRYNWWAWTKDYTTGYLFLWLDISALTEREREVIHFCWEGIDIPEIAKLLHIEESTISSHLSRAYGNLRLNHYQVKVILEAFKHPEEES